MGVFSLLGGSRDMRGFPSSPVIVFFSLRLDSRLKLVVAPPFFLLSSLFSMDLSK